MKAIISKIRALFSPKGKHSNSSNIVTMAQLKQAAEKNKDLLIKDALYIQSICRNWFTLDVLCKRLGKDKVYVRTKLLMLEHLGLIQKKTNHREILFYKVMSNTQDLLEFHLRQKNQLLGEIQSVDIKIKKIRKHIGN